MRILLFALLLALPPQLGGAREWRDVYGRSHYGQLVEYSPPDVTILGPTGYTFTLEEGTLSKEDRRYCALAQSVLNRSLSQVPYRIIEVLEQGLVAEELPDKNPGYSKRLFLIWNHRLATEGGHYRHDMYWAGFYRYKSAQGEERTIDSYARTLDEAVAIQEVRKGPPAPEAPGAGGTAEGGGDADAAPAGQRFSGTSFAITNEGHLVTNAHVIDHADSILVAVGNRLVPAELLALDMEDDLAILKIGEPTKPLSLRSRAPDLGDAVTVAGFPNIGVQGRSIKITKGTLSGLKGIRDDDRHFQIDAAVQPGNSGGPLLDDKNAVVGIIVSSLDEIAMIRRSGAVPQNVNYAIKLERLLPLIKTVPGLTELLSAAASAPPASLREALTGSVFIVEMEIR